MRLFIAIDLSDDVKAALRAAQAELYARKIRGRFTPEENLHLTLAFIGEYPDAEAVLDALNAVSFEPFALTPEGMGCFEDLWWAGVADPAPLAALAGKIRRALAESGIPFDRERFVPHITLIRKPEGELPGTRIPPASMTVDAFSLFRSGCGKNGMIYTELGTVESRPPDTGS